MNKAVDKKHNLKNLKDLSSHMENIEYFIFFGTLLGYHRNNDLIEWDDDIDFYVNIKHRNAIISILETLGLKIRRNHPHFLQGSRVIGNSKTYTDFYFYEDNSDYNYIVERWNFTGKPKNTNSHLHVPKKLIYPIGRGQIKNINFKTPANIKQCCQFLYGEKYDLPLKKGRDYKITHMDNKPVVSYKHK